MSQNRPNSNRPNSDRPESGPLASGPLASSAETHGALTEADRVKVLADLTERYGPEWVEQQRERLDEEWEYLKDF